jgi:putative ABC transport system substrate-binding protein
MAYEILVNGADVTTMPVQYAATVVKEYNAANCEALGITVPSDYTAIEG